MSQVETTRFLPVELDLKKLRESFPTTALTEGREIKYEALESIIGRARRTNRFQTVIQKWRRLLLVESNIALLTMSNVGFKVATDQQKMSAGDNYRKQAMRKVQRSIEHYRAVDTNKLSESEIRSLRASMVANSSVLTAMAMTRELPKPQI